MLTQTTPVSCSPKDGSRSGPLDIAYCVYREGLSSVFHSQVLVPLSLHSDEIRIRTVVHAPLGHLVRRRWRERLDKMAAASKELGLKLDWLASAPARFGWLIDDVRQLSRWLEKNYRGGPVVLHCRNPDMTDIALRARDRVPNARILYDCRGAGTAELEQQLSGHEAQPLPAEARSRIERLRRIEERCAREADHIICVSKSLQEHLIDTFQIPESKVSVVPCCLEPSPEQGEHRATVRSDLGLEDQLVVTYCGSLAWYQFPQQSLRIFRILRSVHQSSHFLAITTQPERMWTEIDQAGVAREQATVISVPAAQVPRYLAAGDVGLLLRDDTIVNRVASPVKFGEYMAAGLPVIISNSVGDYSQEVQLRQLGAVVDLSLPDECLARSLEDFLKHYDQEQSATRLRCRMMAESELSWQRHLPRIAQIYEGLLSAERAR